MTADAGPRSSHFVAFGLRFPDGLHDELRLHVVPILLGGGGVTHLRIGIAKA